MRISPQWDRGLHHSGGEGEPELPRVSAVGTVPPEIWQPESHDAHRVGAALISSVLANVNRAKNTRAFTVTDFAPHFAAAERVAANEPISLEEAMSTWK